MAVITYTLSVVGGAVTITPGLDNIVFTTGDFLAFKKDASVIGDVFVQFTGGSKIFVAAAPETKKMGFQQPFQLDGAGNITIAFEDVGGNSGNPGFPP